MRFPALLVLLAFPLLSACSERLPELESRVKGVDERNTSILFRLSGTLSEQITLDIADMTGEESGADVFRVFWHTAHILKDAGHPQTAVILASFGEPRYRVPKVVVSDVADAYPDQNPVYLIRTFPARVETLDGKQAFPDRRGGLLYVTGKQMEDFGDLVQAWIIQPYLVSRDVKDSDSEIQYKDSEAF